MPQEHTTEGEREKDLARKLYTFAWVLEGDIREIRKGVYRGDHDSWLELRTYIEYRSAELVEMIDTHAQYIEEEED